MPGGWPTGTAPSKRRCRSVLPLGARGFGRFLRGPGRGPGHDTAAEPRYDSRFVSASSLDEMAALEDICLLVLAPTSGLSVERRGQGCAEVLGNLAAYCDPFDLSDSARVLSEVAFGQPLRARVREAGPEQLVRSIWDKPAAATLDAYQEVLAE
jgi:hypothetical protein